jgi:hypothetical protein
MPPKKGAKYAKTKDAEAIREYWRGQIAKDQEVLYNAMLNKAKGVLLQTEDNKGQTIYKELPPDPNAFKALIEHGLGKAPQPIEGTGENGEIVIKTIKFIE